MSFLKVLNTHKVRPAPAARPAPALSQTVTIPIYVEVPSVDQPTVEHPAADPVSEVNAGTPTASSQCNDSQSPVEVWVPQCETTLDSENSAAPDCDEASADTPDSESEHAKSEELEFEPPPETEQTSSTE